MGAFYSGVPWGMKRTIGDSWRSLLRDFLLAEVGINLSVVEFTELMLICSTARPRCGFWRLDCGVFGYGRSRERMFLRADENWFFANRLLAGTVSKSLRQQENLLARCLVPSPLYHFLLQLRRERRGMFTCAWLGDVVGR